MEHQVPVTARLSRKFYDRFGDDIANELVNWFNAVDATYQASLKELNELNFARFDATLGHRLAGMDAKWDKRFAELDAKWEVRFAELDAKWDKRFAELEVRFEKRLSAVQSTLIAWMVGLWFTSVLGFGALFLALVKLR